MKGEVERISAREPLPDARRPRVLTCWHQQGVPGGRLDSACLKNYLGVRVLIIQLMGVDCDDEER